MFLHSHHTEKSSLKHTHLHKQRKSLCPTSYCCSWIQSTVDCQWRRWDLELCLHRNDLPREGIMTQPVTTELSTEAVSDFCRKREKEKETEEIFCRVRDLLVALFSRGRLGPPRGRTNTSYSWRGPWRWSSERSVTAADHSLCLVSRLQHSDNMSTFWYSYSNFGQSVYLVDRSKLKKCIHFFVFPISPSLQEWQKSSRRSESTLSSRLGN